MPPHTSHHTTLKLFSMPTSGCLVLTAAVGALAFAYIMQYGFDYQPCVLCLWERLPYATAALLALMVCLWRPYGTHTQILLMLCSVVFISGLALAFFHTGVERHWWLGTRSCSIHPVDASSLDDLREKLLATVTAPCDEISWTFLGLSMTNWNIPFSLLLAGFSMMAALRRK